MGPGVQIILVMIVFLLLLGVGMTIPFAIGIPAIVYLYLQGGLPSLRGLGLVSWGSMNSFTLMAIPLFILMAELMQRSGLTLRIYDGLSRLVSRIPGSLFQTSIIGCAVFASISGSSIVTAASIGGVALPELMKRGYDHRLSAGSLAAGGTLGILFPPSTAMIIYSTFTDTSVARLFLAGIIPGLMLTALFMLYIAAHTTWRPSLVGRDIGPAQPGWLLRAIVEVVPFLLLIGCTLGSIYVGIATPTEAASIGCVAVLLLALLFGQLTWRILAESLHRTVVVVGNIMFIVYTAFLFSYAISFAGVGEIVTAALVGLDLPRPAFFLSLFVLYTLLGCLVESIGMIVITVPLLYPVLVRYGIDPIWFGVILVLFVELGQISPPIGINLFVIQGLWAGKLSDVVMGTVPFHALMLVLLLLVMTFPALALWLPSHW